MKVRFLSMADQELFDAFEWYEQAQPGLGHALIDEVDRVVHRIAHYPESCADTGDGIRRALVSRFPYGLWYAVEQDALVVYAVPTQVVREVSGWVARRRPAAALQLSLAKGLELHTLLRPTEVIAQETSAAAAALSGPNHAEEISRDMPAATVIASSDAGLARRLQEIVTGDTLRVYTNDDVVGVEFCGAAKNPIAIAARARSGSRRPSARWSKASPRRMRCTT